MAICDSLFFIEYIGNEEGNDFIKNYLKELFGFKVTLQQILDKRFKRGIKIENDRVKEYFTKDKENYEIESIVESFKYIIEEENIRPHQLIIDGLDEKMNEHPKYKEIINALIWSIQELNDYFLKMKYNASVYCCFVGMFLILFQGRI